MARLRFFCNCVALLVFGIAFIQIYINKNQFENQTSTRNKPQFQTIVEFANHDQKAEIHDPNLQLQEIDLTEFISKPPIAKAKLLFWRAICDERNDDLPKAVVVYILQNDPNFALRKNGETIYELVSCRAFVSPGFEIDDLFHNTSVVFTKNLNDGMIVMCPFSRNVSCPKFISVQIGSNPITNFLKVELQDNEDSLQKSGISNQSRFTICAAAITNKVSTVLPARLAEYFEYNKLIGVNKIYMPQFNKSIYPTNGFTDQVEKLLKYYERANFLVRYSVSAAQTAQSERMYTNAERARLMHLSYCVIKIALKTDYVIVQDFDEIIGFDTDKFNTLSDAVMNFRREKGMNYENFMLRDTVFDHHCKPEMPQLNYTNLVIFDAKYHYQKVSLNMGKTIHSSKACIVPFAHFCFLYRISNVLSLPRDSRKLVQKNYIDKRKRFIISSGSFLRSFHFRPPENHRGEPARYMDTKNQLKWCDISNWVETRWLDRIKLPLYENTHKVLYKLSSNY